MPVWKKADPAANGEEAVTADPGTATVAGKVCTSHVVPGANLTTRPGLSSTSPAKSEEVVRILVYRSERRSASAGNPVSIVFGKIAPSDIRRGDLLLSP